MKRGKAGPMRHIVTVMRPPDPQGEGGQLNSQPTRFRNEVPCSIEPLSGRELERMQEMEAVANCKVRFYGDPDKQVKETDWLIDEFGKRINIVAKNDSLRNQQGIVELICMESG